MCSRLWEHFGVSMTWQSFDITMIQKKLLSCHQLFLLNDFIYGWVSVIRYQLLASYSHVLLLGAVNFPTYTRNQAAMLDLINKVESWVGELISSSRQVEAKFGEGSLISPWGVLKKYRDNSLKTAKEIIFWYWMHINIASV